MPLSIIKKFPFQVVVAQSVAADGEELNAEDYVRLRSSISIHKGYLLLAHFSGRWFEFQGDTTFLIGTLQDLTQSSHKDKTRPDISILFSDANPPGLIIENQPTIKLLSPRGGYATDLRTGEDLCVWWRSIYSDPTEFTIQVKNIFDEVIQEFQSDSSRITIPTTQLNEKLIILRVFETGDPSNSSNEFGIRFIEGLPGISLAGCQVKTAGQALMLAYNLESNLELDLSRNFFNEAAELSTFQAFEILRDNFLKRRGYSKNIP